MAREDSRKERFSYDRMIKACLSPFHLELGEWLTGERPVEASEVSTDLAAVEERSADKLLLLTFRGKPDLALHVEFQVEGRRDIPDRMARYLALAGTTRALKERRARLSSFVVYLDRRTYRKDPGFFDLPAGPGTSLRATYNVVRLWGLDPGPILEGESPGLCPFLPLLRGDPRELLVRSREKILRAPESLVPAGVRQDLLLALGAFAGRVIRDRDFIRRVLSEIRDMGDNVFFDLIQEEAMEKGRAEGLASARRAVLRVLARRFGDVPEEVRAHLETVKALDRLERLHDEAITCPDLEAFRTVLGLARGARRGRRRS